MIQPCGCGAALSVLQMATCRQHNGAQAFPPGVRRLLVLRNPFLLAALIVIAAAILVARQVAGPHEATLVSRLERGEALRVGYAIEAPFAFLMPDGTVSGEAPEVFREVLHEQGYTRIEWLHAEFGSLLHELASGRVDAIACGMFITPERARSFRFTRPTAVVRTGLLVRSGNPKGLHSLADIAASSDAHLAVVDGAVEYGQAVEAGVPAGRLTALPDPAAAISALVQGRVDGFALSEVSLRYLLTTEPSGRLELAVPFGSAADDALAGRPAFVFRKSDEDFAARVDQTLDRYLGSPAHRALVARFGFGDAQMPPVERRSAGVVR